MNVIKYHKNQTQITCMICRLNDHIIKHLVTQYRLYHKDTKWHTNMNHRLEQITVILILTLLCLQSLPVLQDVFIFFYQKIKKINDTRSE